MAGIDSLSEAAIRTSRASILLRDSAIRGEAAVHISLWGDRDRCFCL